MISIESGAYSSGYSDPEGSGNMKNQWVMDDFGGALGIHLTPLGEQYGVAPPIDQ